MQLFENQQIKSKKVCRFNKLFKSLQSNSKEKNKDCFKELLHKKYIKMTPINFKQIITRVITKQGVYCSDMDKKGVNCIQKEMIRI